MSFFRWFSKKSKPLARDADSSGLGSIDATLPFQAGGKSRTKTLHSVPGTAANRKNERLERRELLYAVVRESMTRAGLLSTSYKFKVLSLDSRGRQYLIMMDMARQNVGNPQLLGDMESHIAKIAKSRHDILVTAVYWRVNEHVTAGAVKTTNAPEHRKPTQAMSSAAHEPLLAEEVAAFKQALASVPQPTALSAPGEILKSGRRNPAPPSFQDTEMDDRNSPLSGTQYGELH